MPIFRGKKITRLPLLSVDTRRGFYDVGSRRPVKWAGEELDELVRIRDEAVQNSIGLSKSPITLQDLALISLSSTGRNGLPTGSANGVAEHTLSRPFNNAQPLYIYINFGRLQCFLYAIQ